MLPVIGIRSNYTRRDVTRRMTHVAPFVAHRIASSLNSPYVLYRQFYAPTSDYETIINCQASLSLQLRVDRKHKKDVETRMDIVNNMFGEDTISTSYLNIRAYCTTDEGYFREELYVDSATFGDIHQHFLNWKEGRPSYKLTGKLEGMDDILTPVNFRGDPLTQAVKAKAALDMQDVQNQQNQACAKPDGGESKKGEGEKNDERRRTMIQKFRDNKNVNDDYYDGEGGSLDEKDIQEADMLEKTMTKDFMKDKGLITDKQVDLSFDTEIQRTLREDPEGEIFYERQKDYRLNKVRKSDLANPMFLQRFIKKQTLQKKKYVYEDNHERVVFILIDVSGSMAQYGKIRLRNAIISDRFDAVTKGHCQLYIGAYLNRLKGLDKIETSEDAERWISLYPGGGGTSVKNAITGLLARKEFNEFMNMGENRKGEIILVNDGEDSMDMFDNDGSFKVHGMQLGNGPEEDYGNDGLKRLVKGTGGKYIYFDANRIV